MSHPTLDKFKSYLESRGRKLTRERAIVAKCVLQLQPPFNMNDVLAALSLPDGSSSVSRSTIVRTLHDMQQAKLLEFDTSPSPPYGIPKLHYIFPGHSITQNTLTNHNLCDVFHRNLIAGICPWCGQTVFHDPPEEHP